MKNTLLLVPLLGLGITVALSACGSEDAAAPPAADPFVFSTQTADRFLRVDRTGEPAIGTALLSRDTTLFPPLDVNGNPLNPGNTFNNLNDQRDAFNRGEPANDARDFASILTTGPQPNSLRKIHFEVGPQLRTLKLTPCSTETVVPPATDTQVNIMTCVDVVAPVVLPDVITFDLNTPAGWPNGRGFDDPVVDRLLAAALLQISGAGAPHNINSLVGVINPWNGTPGLPCDKPAGCTGDESGTPSPATFPHLRPAHS
ncbi:MAG: hypothetical protein CV089_17700 [Nitrospira sp. WS110]|nr:hypothetical protein [Nitrospira sp. WS110]